MMKAEVTAENKPACGPNERVWIRRTYGTHEDEGGVKILLILLHELLIVLVSLLAVVPIEFRSWILLSGRQVCQLPAAQVLVAFRLRAKENLPFYSLSVILYPTRVLHVPFSRILAVIEDQKWEIVRLWDIETIPRWKTPDRGF